jgi:hypothetical protein
MGLDEVSNGYHLGNGIKTSCLLALSLHCLLYGGVHTVKHQILFGALILVSPGEYMKHEELRILVIVPAGQEVVVEYKHGDTCC